MKRVVSIRSTGDDARLLEIEILKLSDEFSREDVEIDVSLRESMEYGSAESSLFIAIGTGVVVELILRLIDTLLEKRKNTTNVNISIHLEETNITFNLPNDEEKILDYCKKMKN